MAEKQMTNRDRLLRVIRGLQHLQRTNAPNTSLAKSTTKCLDILLKEWTQIIPGDVKPSAEQPS